MHGELTMKEVINYTSIFLKKELLLSDARVGRVIAARLELLRDLC